MSEPTEAQPSPPEIFTGEKWAKEELNRIAYEPFVLSKATRDDFGEGEGEKRAKIVEEMLGELKKDVVNQVIADATDPKVEILRVQRLDESMNLGVGEALAESPLRPDQIVERYKEAQKSDGEITDILRGYFATTITAKKREYQALGALAEIAKLTKVPKEKVIEEYMSYILEAKKKFPEINEWSGSVVNLTRLIGYLDKAMEDNNFFWNPLTKTYVYMSEEPIVSPEDPRIGALKHLASEILRLSWDNKRVFGVRDEEVQDEALRKMQVVTEILRGLGMSKVEQVIMDEGLDTKTKLEIVRWLGASMNNGVEMALAKLPLLPKEIVERYKKDGKIIDILHGYFAVAITTESGLYQAFETLNEIARLTDVSIEEVIEKYMPYILIAKEKLPEINESKYPERPGKLDGIMLYYGFSWKEEDGSYRYTRSNPVPSQPSK